MTKVKKHSLLREDIKLVDSIKVHSRELSERLLEVVALYNLSKSLNINFQMDNIFGEIEELLKDSLAINDFSIMLLDDSGKELSLYSANSSTFEAAKGVSFKVGEGITGLVAKTCESILIQDVSKDSRFLYYKGKKKDIGSFLSVPLINKNDELLGVCNIHKKEINGFRESDMVVYNAVAHHISLALENSKIFQEVKKLAITDELTQSYSRRYFIDALEKEISVSQRREYNFSIIMVDIDFFKSINDNYGQIVGDDVLIKLAEVMRANTRQGDVIARYGGEEFLILLPGIDKKNALDVAEKIRSKIEKDLVVKVKGRAAARTTISSGVVTFPESGKTSGELISAVDELLYHAKRTGRNKVCGSIKKESQRKVSDNKRNDVRYFVSMSASSKPNYVQFIEMNIKDQWMMCIVDDISKNGFKGIIDFEPKKGTEFQCRVISKSDVIPSELFYASIMHKEKIRKGRYAVGVEVAGNSTVWKNLYSHICT